MPTVKIPPVLRAQTDGQAEFETEGETVGDVLRSLAATHPATRSQLFSDGGELNRYVNVYLNDEDVRVLDGLDTPVSRSDTVVILPAMAGGAADDGLSPRHESARRVPSPRLSDGG
jgi:MoaD family protein